MDKVKNNIEYTKKNWTGHMRSLSHFLYTEKIHYYPFYSWLKKKILQIRIKNPHAELLDIGFGSGFHLKTFSKRFGLKTIGTDIASETIDRYNRLNIPMSKAIQIDPYTNSIPLPNDSYDIIICSHVIEHVPDEKKLLSEIRRLVSEKGTVYFNIPINEENIDVPNHLRKYTPESFLLLLSKNGFIPLQYQESDNFSHFISWLGTHQTFFNNIMKKSLIFFLSLIPISWLERINLKKSQFICFAEKTDKKTTD